MLKKDLLVFWRDRKEVLMSLLLPIVIIVVLSLVLSGVFESESSIEIDAALVIEDNPEAGLEQFASELDDLGMTEAEKESMLSQAEMFNPSIMIQDFFNNPELSDLMTIEEMSLEEATNQVEAGDLDAIALIPANFTQSFLSEAMLDQGGHAEIQILAEEKSNELTTFENIIGNYIETMNFQLAVNQLEGAEMTEPVLPEGDREQIAGEDAESFNITQYFALAIGSLFALFISQTVAMKTITEKREQVFNRIQLTNHKPIYFLMGKVVASFVFAWVQVMVTILTIHLLFDVFPNATMEFWMTVLIAVTGYSIAIGGLTGVFTSLTLKLKNPDAISAISMVVIMAFGTLGGGFFPIMNLPNILQLIGSWTPNGLFLTSMIEYIQQPSMQELIVPVVYFIIFFVASLILAMAIFPKRGRS